MIFFVIPKTGKRKVESNYQERLTKNYLLISWNEVYSTLYELKKAVFNCAKYDPVCQKMSENAKEVFGINLIPFFPLNMDEKVDYSIADDSMNTETERIVNKVFSDWANPMIGNIANSPQIRPDTCRDNYEKNWNVCSFIDGVTKKEITELFKTFGSLTRAGRDQVKIVYNITELTRAIIGEITTNATRRLEKILALRLCHSDQLHEKQKNMIDEYLKKRGNKLAEEIKKTGKEVQGVMNEFHAWKSFEYCKYYLPQEIGNLTDRNQLLQLICELVKSAINKNYIIPNDKKSEEDFPALLKRTLKIWSKIPHTIRCAILMNDFRKVDSLQAKNPAKTSIEAIEKSFCITKAAGNSHVPKFQSQGRDLTWSWNRDEYHPTTTTYRSRLLPLWGGPSGHAGGNLAFWKEALGDHFPLDGAITITCGLFALWRLYYDRRISPNHTMAETFEATFTEPITGITSENLKTKVILKFSSSAPSTSTDDAFDFVSSCSGVLKGNPKDYYSVAPICLMAKLYQTYYSMSINYQENYKKLEEQLNIEKEKLTSNHYWIPEWSKEISTKIGTKVKQFGFTTEDKPSLAYLKFTVSRMTGNKILNK